MRTSAVLACLAVAVFSASASAAPAAAANRIILRAYNPYGLSADELRTAAGTVEALLSAIGIESEWRNCRSATRVAPEATEDCSTPLAANEVVVRLMASGPGDLPRTALGNSIVNAGTGSGTFSTIYADRIRFVARALDADAGTILGRAVAHEIGHLLLGTNIHSQSGLMRDVWSNKTISANRGDDWTFTPQQAQGIRAGLEMRFRVAPAPRVPAVAGQPTLSETAR